MRVLECSPPGQPRTRIEIGPGILPGAFAAAGARFTVCDRAVAGRLPAALSSGPARLVLEAGETAKSFATLEVLLRALARAEIDRGGLLVAAGGGTIGDLAGLAAAVWLRGIAFELVPTTLLSMVDSSVGGKTAINLPEGKNLVGAFWPPARVVIDPELLDTLPEREFRSGLGEVLKAAIGLDRALFELCEAEAGAVLAREPAALARVVELAVAAKIRIVEADFREGGARRLLNLGHTLGHALEAASGFAVPHGVAVARGLHFALDVAERDGAIAAADAERCRALLARYGFTATAIPTRDELAAFVRRDKKRAGDALHFVLPTGIGSAVARPMPLAAVIEVLG